MRRKLRPARLLGLLLAALIAGLVLVPTAWAQPPQRLSDYVTDDAGVLSAGELSQVQSAVESLYTARRVRLWVVYVDTFSGQSAQTWQRNTRRLNDFQNEDAVLAVATGDRAYSFIVPNSATGGVDVDKLRRNEIEPALRRGDWAGAAVAAAQGLERNDGGGGNSSWVGLVVALAVIAIGVGALVMWRRRRRHKRREAEFAAAQRVDPTDPAALASVPVDALDELSRSIVVDVDNAARTSENELVLAVEEFGEKDTAPFTAAVGNARKTLKQAFNVRQILDDDVPETPQQQRDLLTRVIVAAAKADRELDEQRDAFGRMRDLVINAPTRLDNLTQQMVALTARIEPSRQTLRALAAQFAESALASVDDNVETAEARLSFADENITNARTLVARPAGGQGGLVDAVRAAESALGQARKMLDAVDSAATDINRAVAGLPDAIADIQNGIKHASDLLADGSGPHAGDLSSARDAAVEAVAHAQNDGSADPLGTFTQLTQADADLDRLLETVTEEREAAERMGRALDQALFAAQSRVKSASDFIDTRRGSIGPDARTRLAEAARQLEAAQDKRSADLPGAIAHANRAATLAGHAQTLANTDLQNAQRAYTGRYGGRGGGSAGAILGGIVLGGMLSGGMGGGIGGGWSSPTFGGSGGGFGGGGFGGGGGGFSGGGGRF